ncbi:hypothetical protein KJ656_07950 [bacterium]|nr:hypothetical protein [bacterium]
MSKKNYEQLWTVKGATLSDKSARKEYKLTQEEILEGINEGKLHYRVNYIYDNPWFRLLRSDVEKFVEERHGANHLHVIKLKTELKQIEKEIKALKTQTQSLEIRKAEIHALLEIKKGKE